MELWENEVYRFKTIGQLKVGQGLRFQSFVSFFQHQCLFNIAPPLSDFRPSVSICPEGICVSDRPSMKWSCMNFSKLIMRYFPPPIVLTSSVNPSVDRQLMVFSHFLCCPRRVSPHWSVNGLESFIITWPLFRRSPITWRGIPLTGRCSPRWLNCEWSQHKHYRTHRINIEGNIILLWYISTQVVSF